MDAILVDSSGDETPTLVTCSQRLRQLPARRRGPVPFHVAARCERISRRRKRRCRQAARALLSAVANARAADAAIDVISSEDEVPAVVPSRVSAVVAEGSVSSTAAGHPSELALPTRSSQRQDEAVVVKEYARHVAALGRDPLPPRYRLRRPRWAKYPPVRGWWTATEPQS